MSNVQNFIINNMGLIVTLIVAILGLVQALISKNRQQVYTNVYGLVSDAEQLANATGLEKFQYVFDTIYGKLPSFLKFFISEDDIKRAIEYSLNKLQAFADQQAKAQSTQAITNNIAINTSVQSPADIAAKTQENASPIGNKSDPNVIADMHTDNITGPQDTSEIGMK